MRMYIDNSTGNLCFLTFINYSKFEMEYEWGYFKGTVNASKISPQKYIEENYTEIGFFS